MVVMNNDGMVCVNHPNCGSQIAFGIEVYNCGQVYNWKDGSVSYVNSSRYESETSLQEAERRLKEYKEMVQAAQNRVTRLKKEARFGEQPSTGSIIKFEKRYNGVGCSKAYYYAALRVGNLWYLTSSGGVNTPKSWEELKQFIGDSKMWTPKNYVQAPDA